MADKYFENDIGTEVLMDCQESIADATVIQFKVKKSDGTEATWEGILHNENFIKYITIESSFNLWGKYEIQPYIETPTWKGHGTVDTFVIDKKLF